MTDIMCGVATLVAAGWAIATGVVWLPLLILLAFIVVASLWEKRESR